MRNEGATLSLARAAATFMQQLPTWDHFFSNWRPCSVSFPIAITMGVWACIVAVEEGLTAAVDRQRQRAQTVTICVHVRVCATLYACMPVNVDHHLCEHLHMCMCRLCACVYCNKDKWALLCGVNQPSAKSPTSTKCQSTRLNQPSVNHPRHPNVKSTCLSQASISHY